MRIIKMCVSLSCNNYGEYNSDEFGYNGYRKRKYKPIIYLCTLCPILMVGLNKFRVIHRPCQMHGAMQDFFDNGGEFWV